MKCEPITSLKESALQQAAVSPRNKFIKEAYASIVCRISNKIDINAARAWNKFPRQMQPIVNQSNLIEAFYTPYCSVKLITRRMNYIIQLTVTHQAFNAGIGINSTALLRIAFEATAYEREGFRIQDALEIKVNNNIEAIYKQKVDERIDKANLKYFNKKMRIEG